MTPINVVLLSAPMARHRILVRDEDSRKELYVGEQDEEPPAVIRLFGGVSVVRDYRLVDTRVVDEVTEHIYLEKTPLQ